MTWLIDVILSISLFTCLNLLQRKVAVESQHPRAMGFLFNLAAGLMAWSLFFLTGGYHSFSLPHLPVAWIILILAIVFYGLFERGRFFGAQLLDAGTFDILFNISLVVSFIASALIYKEAITTSKVIGVALIILASVLVTYEKKKVEKTTYISTKGILISLIICSIIGFAWVFDKGATHYFNPATYQVFVWTFPAIFIYLPSIRLDQLKQEAHHASWNIFLLAGLNVGGYYFQLKALALADATRVIPLISTSILTTVVLGIFLLNEKQNVPQKLIAGILAFIGTLFIV